MFYPNPNAIEKAKADALKNKAKIESELQQMKDEITKLERDNAESVSSVDFNSFKEVTTKIIELKEKVKFYEDYLTKYADGEFPTVLNKDICDSWNEVSKSLIRKVDKSFDDIIKARDLYIKEIEKYGEIVKDALGTYYGYRNQISPSGFNRLGHTVDEFAEINKHTLHDCLNIESYLHDINLGKYNYLFNILERGVIWEE